MRRLIYIIFFLLVIRGLIGQPITVGIGGDFTTLEAAESSIGPGDTIIILDGSYSDGTQFLSLQGTTSAPIVIMAETMFGAVFQGGSEAIHLVSSNHVELNGLLITQQTGNGINIDDGGNYYGTPTRHITIRNCLFQDMNSNGNSDFLKLSGLDSFLVENCQFTNGGDGGSGIDMVGCHYGTIQDCHLDDAGVTGIQAKGGTQYILMRRNWLENMSQRALNLGGSTGLQFFRPPLVEPYEDVFEAADLEVFSNIFIGSHAPIAYVGSVRVKVYNNTIVMPGNWVFRILQETTEEGFLPCGDNEFRNNIIYLSNDLTEVNIGPNTAEETFIISNNCWYNASSDTWSPVLPVVESNQIIDTPMFVNLGLEDFSLQNNSPCIGNGMTFGEPSTDYIGQPYANPPSIGAFEGGTVTPYYSFEIQDEGIEIFPNPTENTVKVDGDFSNANIEILNSSGIVVDDYSNAMAPLTIDLESLPAGLYFIRISSQLYNTMNVQLIVKMD